MHVPAKKEKRNNEQPNTHPQKQKPDLKKNVSKTEISHFQQTAFSVILNMYEKKNYICFPWISFKSFDKLLLGFTNEFVRELMRNKTGGVRWIGEEMVVSGWVSGQWRVCQITVSTPSLTPSPILTTDWMKICNGLYFPLWHSVVKTMFSEP